MRTLHIANTFFEWELEQTSGLSEAFAQHPIFRQLQFLPVLYAPCEAGVLLADKPQPEYWNHLKQLGIEPPEPAYLESFSRGSFNCIESWGPSLLIDAFAKKHRLNYAIPDWGVVKEVNSKAFSFSSSPKLPNASLLHNKNEAGNWLDAFEGKKVLKTCYGVSGKGHLVLEGDSLPQERIDSFLEKEWKKGLPVIAEPWVDRVLDFSTQWEIDEQQQIVYVGATLCENDSRGQYCSNTVGEEGVLFGAHLPFLHEHKKCVLPILAQMAEKGFFGNVGIDAMVYALPGKENERLLHPVVEINARKTMGWTALQFARRYHSGRIVKFRFSQCNEGYLPEALAEKNGKVFAFHRNLEISPV